MKYSARLRPLFAAFRLLTASLVLLVSLLATKDAHAYAWMVRREYTACTACHADPSGGSLLTPYGRALGEMLLKSHYDGKDPESVDPGKAAEFAFGALKLPESLLLQVDARVAYLRTMDGSFTKRDSRLLHMQSDVIGQYTAGRLRFNASLGYLNTHDYLNKDGRNPSASGPIWITGDGSSAAGRSFHLVSRHHWVGYDIGEDKNMLLRAGRMNLPFGLRIIEHDSWVRRDTMTDVNKFQQHGVSFAYNSEKIRTEIMGIAGNFQLSPDAYRARGYAGYLEYALKQNLTVGGSSMITHASRDIAAPTGPAFRQAHGAFARWSPARPLVVMAEADVAVFSPKGQNAKSTLVGLAQADYEPMQGLHLIGTLETRNQDFKSNDAVTGYGAWASVHWYFVSRVDARIDFIHREEASATNTLFLQLHAYL